MIELHRTEQPATYKTFVTATAVIMNSMAVIVLWLFSVSFYTSFIINNSIHITFCSITVYF